ncbi:hypothetical protein chiPu_0014534 [Chiloscyllium punctatum]|uniref:SEFIR domain-containing protein n=1 Tax=Chiloscyllium punctatum TaxID=137246 RepID=A0A401T068_CHIPU|nr:hypothetical protein [Chiloscyllium punctatum]
MDSRIPGTIPGWCFRLVVASLAALGLADSSRYETLALSNRTVGSCTEDCSQKNLPCRVIKGDCLSKHHDTWPLSPPRHMDIHIVLLKGVGPVLEINFTYSADANLISINKTVIAISQVGSVQCVTYWYINGFPAQTNYKGELWSLTYHSCHRLKPAQLLSVNIYSIPPTEALVKNVRLPDCNNPMMKLYAKDYCPATHGCIWENQQHQIQECPSDPMSLCPGSHKKPQSVPRANGVSIQRESSTDNQVGINCISSPVATQRLSGNLHHQDQSDVWSDDIYPLPEKIYCTQPKRTLSRWLAAISLISLILCPLAAMIFYKKYRKKYQLYQKRQEENEQLKVLMAPVKLLLLCSWDHKYFQGVIEAFAWYLEQDCKCEVILEIWERRQLAKTGAMIWLSEKLATADKVTIVWSKGAELKWKSKSLLEEDQPYFVEFEFGDLFTPALVSVADHSPRGLTEKFSVVYFERISAGVKVPEIFRKKQIYKLMADLQKFQHTLRYTTGTDWTDSKARQKLVDSIEAFATYQRLSPSWFEDWHRREGDNQVSCSSSAFPQNIFSTSDQPVMQESNPL